MTSVLAYSTLSREASARRRLPTCHAKPSQSVKTVHWAEARYDCFEHSDLLRVTLKPRSLTLNP